jgi:hypothetical protein
MRRLCRGFPFTIATLAGLLLSWAAASQDVLYDSGGFGSLVYYLGWLLQFLVSLAHEIVHDFHLPTLGLHRGTSIALGLTFALGLDLALRKLCLPGRSKIVTGSLPNNGDTQT